MSEDGASKAGISRRDFLKLGGAATAAVALSQYLDLSPDLIISSDETTKTKSLSNFRLDKEITQAEIESCKQMFKKVAVGIQELKQDSGFLQEESVVIDSFDNEVFLKNSTEYVDKVVRLQKVYKKFDNDLYLDKKVKSEALNLLKHNFRKLAIPLNVFDKVNNENLDVSSKDLAKKFLLDAKELTEEIPIDPLIGMDIYTEIGMQTWFSEFDIKYVDGAAVGTYPVTKRFLTESGKILKELTEQAGASHEKGNLPPKRPDQFEFETDNESVEYRDIEYKQITVDSEVKEKIYTELEKGGIDRVMTTLVIRSNDNNLDLGGFVNHGFTEEVNVLIGTNKLDKTYFDKNEKIIIHVIKHEVFHALMNEVNKMDDYDSYLIYARINRMYKSTCPFFDKHEISNEEELSLSPFIDTYMFVKKSTENLNEAYRNRYSNDLIIGESAHLFSEVIHFYKSEMYKDKKFWNSSLLDVDFEKFDKYQTLSNQDRIALGKKSMDWLADHVKTIYHDQKDSMTNLEKFVSEELIERSKNGSLFSEMTFYQSGMVPSEFANRYIPSILMYSSIMRNDWKFINAVSKDINEKVATGVISENKKSYILRKLGYMINLNKESNGNGGGVGQIVNEHLADQFALSLNENLGYDFRNAGSSLKAHSVINKLKPEFKKILDFYKQRNLARVENNLI